FLFFFFSSRRRHTRFDCDWSSDVCSSDLPAISGTAQQGQNLYTTNGSWSGGPTSYQYQWLRCDTAGANCVPIWGEVFYGITLGATEANHTVRVTVTASNPSGSAAATSAATAVVK